MGKYLFRPLLFLEYLYLLEKKGEFCYRYGKDANEMPRTDYLEFMAFFTDWAVVDRLVNQLKLIFVTQRPSRYTSLVKNF